MLAIKQEGYYELGLNYCHYHTKINILPYRYKYSNELNRMYEIHWKIIQPTSIIILKIQNLNMLYDNNNGNLYFSKLDTKYMYWNL